MVSDEDIKEYVEFTIKYPKLSIGEKHSIFPNYEDLDRHPRVRRLKAQIKIREQDELNKLGSEKSYVDSVINDKVQTGRLKAVDLVLQALDSEDPQIWKWAASKMLQLGGDYAYFAKLREMEAQFTASKDTTDESYPEPPRPDLAVV